MTTKSIRVDSHEIAYRESSGSGSPVVLVHGNSFSSRIFEPQLQSQLGQKHRLVALDLPGHGASPNATDPAATYNLPGYARLVAGFAGQLGLEDAVFVGWSLGGHILIEALPQLPRAKGVLMYGTPPIAFPPDMANAFLPNPAMGFSFNPSPSAEEADAFCAACLKPGLNVPAFFLEDVLRTDGQARAQLAASIQPNGYTDEIVAVANMTIPLAVIHGEHEQLVNAMYLQTLHMPTLWRGAVQIVNDAGHATNWEKPAEFNALLEAFIAS